jgi:hypothetical protein
MTLRAYVFRKFAHLIRNLHVISWNQYTPVSVYEYIVTPLYFFRLAEACLKISGFNPKKTKIYQLRVCKKNF